MVPLTQNGDKAWGSALDWKWSNGVHRFCNLFILCYRWEAENQQTADPSTLVGHLETASIINQLLRREVQMWTEKHDAVSQQLSKAREDLKKKRELQRQEEYKVNQVNRLAKVSV